MLNYCHSTFIEGIIVCDFHLLQCSPEANCLVSTEDIEPSTDQEVLETSTPNGRVVKKSRRLL